METSAKLRFARISPQKVRLVADQVRGMSAEQAVTLLDFSVKRAASMMKKLLMSAIANAENNHSMAVDELKVSQVYVDAGPSMKRIRARARGRACRILKPTSHLTIVVSDSSRSV